MIFIKFTSTNEPQSMHPEENGAVADHFAKQSSEWFKGWQDLGQSPKVLGDFKYEGNKHK